jgi:hypothetical protein
LSPHAFKKPTIYQPSPLSKQQQRNFSKQLSKTPAFSQSSKFSFTR